jgi:uridine kinase
MTGRIKAEPGRPNADPSPNQNPPHRGGSGSKSSYRLGMSVLRLDDVIAEVMERTADGGIRIIGVDGPQGSGKSTLAARIATRIGAPLVQMDDFVSWVDLMGWWPRFEAQVLNPLLSGSDAHYQVRDWENDEFGTSLNGWKTLEWSPVVVLEGLTCTRAAAAKRLAYRIWVEAPDEVRLRRGLERDGETHRELWLDSMTTERQFFTEDATRTRADLRVNGNPDISHDQASEVVLLE